ncbi:MAG: CDP-archaeol synthase [Solirubrobacteraceae bacterium]
MFLPALGAALAHAPVLRWDLIPALRRPINRRLFGEDKTWRGAVMTGGTLAGALAFVSPSSYGRRLPQPVVDANPVLLGTLLGGACWLGELPNSFLKRRLASERPNPLRGRLVSSPNDQPMTLGTC